MEKNLKATQEDKCNGCELCTLESQRQLKKVGLEESLIRIFKGRSENSYQVEIDPRVAVLDIEKIKSICPKDVFEITDND